MNEEDDDDNAENGVQCPNFNIAITQLRRRVTPNCVIGSTVALLILT